MVIKIKVNNDALHKNMIPCFKACLLKVTSYKTITSQNLSSEAQVKIFFYFVETFCSVLEIPKLSYF